MGITDDGNLKNEIFNRMDLTALNKHYSTVSFSKSSPESDLSNSIDVESPWCTKQFMDAIVSTVPGDALSISELSQESYHSLLLKQQNAGPDPNLQKSTKNERKATSFGFTDSSSNNEGDKGLRLL